MEYGAVIFDLDGTLLDTIADIADSMNITLAEHGFPGHGIEAYKSFVGDGITEFVLRSLPATHREPERICTLVAGMRAEYANRWRNNTVPFDGIPELLDALTSAGLKLAVLSNKPDDFTKMMIRALLPGWHFDPLLGARDQVPRKPHPAGALEIARYLTLEPGRCVYLGDSETDMQAAVAAGMIPVGVSWGFRSAGQLISSGAQTVIDTPAELLRLI
ncbi:HAD family hydrolase [bacterium]|nr:HAD family hydrolase [candidate division CSSED10-310 bacterium]